jgi:hypothetical protein
MGGGGHGGRSWAQTRVETAVGDETRTRRSRGRRLLLCVRVREATRHGEAMAARARGSANWRFGAREGGQRPGLASRVTGRACWGARLREGVAARTGARERECERDATRTHRHGATATKTGRLPTARGARLGRRRARVGEGGGTCKKTRPSLARWPASPAAARRRGGVPPRLEGRGVHRGGEAASSPGWPLADVQASVKGARRCDEEGGGAGRGRRTARWRGSRGSRGRRRAWLPRVRLLLAGGSGFAAGGAAPGSSSSSPSPSPPAAGR